MSDETLFPNKTEFIHVESVIGSGYEQQVADLAIRLFVLVKWVTLLKIGSIQ